MTDDGFDQAPQERQPEEVEAYRDFVVNQLRAGTEPAQIIELLVEQGVGRGQASYLVDSTQSLLVEAVAAEQVTGQAILLGAVGGLLAAALGGAVWALVVAGTESEFGLIAWGIGGLCGFAVVLFARGKKGVPLQIVAVVSSLLGILGGKYGMVYLAIKEYAEQEAGAEEAANLPFFSPDLIEAFFTHAGGWLSGFDLLWVGLAVFTAWGIPKAGGLGGMLKKIT